MCKIILLSDASRVPNLKQFKNLCQDLLKDHLDGFGFTVETDTGRYIERVCYGTQEYDIQGNLSRPTGPLMAHGRTSTNALGVVNTHPLSNETYTLVHNGVVTHYGEEYEKTTQNDTEDLLFEFTKNDKNLQDMADNLSGYYAVGAIDNAKRLHVFKCATANLFFAYFEKLNSYVFVSTEALLEKLAIYFNEVVLTVPFPDDTRIIISKNRLVSKSSFTSTGFADREAIWAKHSLGQELQSSIDINDFIIEYYHNELSIEDFLTLDISERRQCKFYDKNFNEYTLNEFLDMVA